LADCALPLPPPKPKRWAVHLCGSRFADVRELGALLQRAGFTLPVADVERTTVQYRELPRLFADLKALGETNVLAGRRKSFLSRRTLERLLSEYAARFRDAEARFAATFDIVFLIGWHVASGNDRFGQGAPRRGAVP
jgi:hypothetical protein